MTKRTFFHFDAAAFNTIAGVKFAVACVVAMGLSAFTDLDLLVVLMATFFAWMTDVPGPKRNRLLGMVAFAGLGVALVWIAAAVAKNPLWFPIALATVAFVLTLPMAVSQRGYMVGWVSILWFLSISAFTGPDAAVQTELTIDLLIGVLIVIATTALWPTGMGPWGRSDASTLEPGGVDDTGFVLVYAATFAIVLGIALYLGMQIFTAGAIWVANGAFMILGPSTNQSFVHAIERAAAAVVGTVIGLTAVGLISSDVVLIVLWGLFAFVALGSLNAGYFVMVGAYTAGMTMTWAVQGQDVSTLNSTNRVLAEGIALVIVLIAVAFLKWWAKHRRVTGHVEAKLAS